MNKNENEEEIYEESYKYEGKKTRKNLIVVVPEKTSFLKQACFKRMATMSLASLSFICVLVYLKICYCITSLTGLWVCLIANALFVYKYKNGKGWRK